MATKSYLVEKLKPGRKIRPYQVQECDISTNKRYRGSDGRTEV